MTSSCKAASASPRGRSCTWQALGSRRGRVWRFCAQCKLQTALFEVTALKVRYISQLLTPQRLLIQKFFVCLQKFQLRSCLLPCLGRKTSANLVAFGKTFHCQPQFGPMFHLHVLWFLLCDSLAGLLHLLQAKLTSLGSILPTEVEEAMDRLLERNAVAAGHVTLAGLKTALLEFFAAALSPSGLASLVQNSGEARLARARVAALLRNPGSRRHNPFCGKTALEACCQRTGSLAQLVRGRRCGSCGWSAHRLCATCSRPSLRCQRRRRRRFRSWSG